MENKKRGSEIFLGLIGVATLVVAIIGATFAFFSASANSATNAISVGSTDIKLDFVDSTMTNLKSGLIPATQTIATYAALEQTLPATQGENEQCIDDMGNEVCGVYQFTICNGTLVLDSQTNEKTDTCTANATSTQEVTFTLNIVTNTFTNLKYAIYTGAVTSLSSSSTPKIAATTFPASGSVPLQLGNLTSAEDYDADDDGEPDGLVYRLGTAANANAVTYTMVIWLNETGENQSDTGVTAGTTDAQSGNTNESGKSFAAGINISTGGNSGGITGVISAAG